MDETKLTAALPNLDIQVIHRDCPEENAEIIAIQFRATPSFEAIRGTVGPHLLAATLARNPVAAFWLAPMQAWSGLVQQLVRQVWAPWLNAVGLQLEPPKR